MTDTYKVTVTNDDGVEMGSVEVEADSKEAAIEAAQAEWEFASDEGHYTITAVKVE
jgi:hypothetical protein